MDFTTAQMVEIDGMVRVGTIPPRPPYHQPHIWSAMVREARTQMAAQSRVEDKPDGALYYTRGPRFQGRLGSKWHAIHEAGSDGVPICREGWGHGWDETRKLDEGWVTCGHCAKQR